jgi:hypothetical protein
VLHVVFGGLGALGSCVLLVLGFATLFPSVLGVTRLPDFGAMAEGAFGAGVTILGLGVTRFVASLLLVVAGIRVFDVAPSGPMLSRAAVMMWTMANVAEFFATRRSLTVFLLASAYPVVVELLFLRGDWQREFARSR